MPKSIQERERAFSQSAIQYGLPTPKGVLILGIPGTGKSLTAKATARVFGMPLLKLDAGRIFAGLVGHRNPISDPSFKRLRQSRRAACGLMKLRRGSAAAKVLAQRMEERRQGIRFVHELDAGKESTGVHRRDRK